MLKTTFLSSLVISKLLTSYVEFSIIQVNTPAVGATSIQTTSENVEFPEVLDQYKRVKDHLCLLAPKFKMAKDFDSTIHPPLINMEDSRLILDIIPPIELHLLLGIVNYLFKNLSEHWPRAKQWPALLHIQLQPHHGGQLAGNECHKLLQNFDILQRLAKRLVLMKLRVSLKHFCNFRDNVSSCFGKSLEGDFKEKIEEFKDSFLSLPVTVIDMGLHLDCSVNKQLKQCIQSLRLTGKDSSKALHILSMEPSF